VFEWCIGEVTKPRVWLHCQQRFFFSASKVSYNIALWYRSSSNLH